MAEHDVYTVGTAKFEEVSIVPRNILLRNQVVSLGDIRFTSKLKSNLYLECTAAGTTAAAIPSFANAVEGSTVYDGSVTWTVRDFRKATSAATATTAQSCTGNAATATTAARCTGNAATATTATTAQSCTGNAATATTAASCSGNAASATKLQTARTINGTSFNGTANITTANWGTARNISIKDSASAHTGTAVSVNGSGNVSIPLPGTISANIVGNVTGNTSGSSGSCTGNSATATKLATARTINIQDSSATNTGTGASFDGSGNATIKLPGTIKANITGNCSGSSGSCTGNAATATTAASCSGNAATATKINGKTVAVVSGFNSSTGVLTLVGLS